MMTVEERVARILLILDASKLGDNEPLALQFGRLHTLDAARFGRPE